MIEYNHPAIVRVGAAGLFHTCEKPNGMMLWLKFEGKLKKLDSA